MKLIDNGPFFTLPLKQFLTDKINKLFRKTRGNKSTTVQSFAKSEYRAANLSINRGLLGRFSEKLVTPLRIGNALSVNGICV